MILTPAGLRLNYDELGLFLRLAIMRLGGEMTLRIDSREMETSDQIELFANVTEDEGGIVLTVRRVDEENAGHA